MAEILLSEAEKAFIHHGVQVGKLLYLSANILYKHL